MYKKINTGYILSKTEASALMFDIANQSLNEFQVAAIIGIYKTRLPTLNELCGFKDALLELSTPVGLSKACIDVCGTGGDNKNTFNISTLSALILAASGVPVAKHGNHGASSVSGSSDVLKYFGYQFKTNEKELNAELEKFNICFIHAPLFHPALKTVALMRKKLQGNSFFNLLGPLINPANPKFRYIGCYNLQIARLYHYNFQTTNHQYKIVHSIDGYDEISLTAVARIFSNTTEALKNPDQLGFSKLKQSDLHAGETVEAAATIFLNVLQNKATKAQKQVVIANTALAMNCYYQTMPLQHCILQATETIDSLKAYHLFKNLLNN